MMSATTSTPVGAITPRVRERTSVTRVGAPNPSTGVPVVLEGRPQLDSKAWKHSLASHPDHEFVNKIINYTDYGVPIGYHGPRQYRIHPNWNSARKYGDVVYDTLMSDTISL